MASVGLPAWLVSNAPTAVVQPADNTTRQWWPAQGLGQHTGTVEKEEQSRCRTAAFQADDEESLEALTALCVQPRTEAPNTAVVPPDCGTKAVVAALSGPAQDGLQKTCTQDSNSTAGLLPMLHAGDITQRLQSMPHEPGGKHDTSVELYRGPAHLGVCKADGAAALAAAQIEDGYDMPLVSKRKNAILDIMCGRSPIDNVGSPVRASSQRVPFLLSSIPAANSSGKAFSPTPGGSGISPSHSPGESGGPSGGATSTCDASLLSILTAADPSSAPTAVLSSGPMSYTSPEVVQSARVLYVGVFLTSESREVLLSMVPAVHPLLRGDHMTLVYMPSVLQLLQFPVGAEVQLRVLGSAANARVQAVFVEAPAWLETSSASAHITISVAAGAQAVEAGQLICDALQEAALASAADWPDATAAAGGAPYQHFDEPLPLVGRLGVRLAVPAATAASMGWSSAAGGAGRAAGGEVEVVVYSADELAGCGCCEIGREAMEAFHRQHGHLLGAQVASAPGFSPQSLLPTVPESEAASACGTPLSGKLLQPASAQSPPAGNSPWLPALLSASTPPAVTPTANSPHTAAGSAAFAPAAVAATGACGSPLGQQCSPSGGLAALLAARNSNGSSGTALQPSLPSGGGLGALLRAAGHNSSSVSPSGPAALSHSTVDQPPFFSLRASAAADTTAAADTAAAVDASLPDSPRSTSSGDSDSSSSSMDAVQFFSAVHVGDYVAVRPFVPTEGNERLLQGYVREFACDEPFQAEGVLAVLTDNTIGYVAVVLESTGARGGGSSSAAAASAAGPSTKQGSPASCSSNAFNGLSLSYTLDPTFALGSSTAAAGGAGSSAAAQDFLDQMCMLEAGCADTPVVLDAHGGQPRRRNARDAGRDLQLWREFEPLQQQHGEVLCSTILESCNQDFAEAIELIKGQAGGMQGFPAATAAADSSSAAAAVSPQPAAAPRVSAGDDGLVSQLALSLGLVPEHALQLARLVPDMPAEAVVQALQQHSGDVGEAADALLSNQATAGDADSSTSTPIRSSHGPRDVPGSEQHSAMSFMAGRDGSHVAVVMQLQAMVPGLGEDMAGLLLDEHGGDLLKAAEMLEEMQARELEARSAAAASVPGSSTRTAPAAGPSTSAAAGAGSSLAGIEGLSEADQLAILAAMGELDPSEAPSEAPQQQQLGTQQYSHSPPQWQHASPTRGSPKAATHSPHSPPQAPAVAGPSRFCPPVHVSPPQPTVRFTQPPPPPPPPQRDSLDRRVAKEQADELYKKGTKFSEGANILLTAAQDALNAGDNKAFREYKARADELRKQARAAIEKAQSISWSANNAHSQVWEVDLHGLGVTKAVAKFERQFRSLRGMDHPGGVLFRVIVGRGLHSEGNIPKIKLGILQYMKEQGEAAAADEGKPWGVTYGIDPTNPGVINVHIPADAETEE